jgi:hypothetical protein
MHASLEKEDPAAPLDRLPWKDLLPQILTFVGDHHYRYIGAVNHAFRAAYVAHFPSKKTHFNVSSVAMAQLCMNDCALKWDSFYSSQEALEDDDHSDFDGSFDGSQLCHKAAACNFEVLKYLYSVRDKTKIEDVWGSYLISSSAAEAGHFHVVQWLHVQGIPWCEETCHAAARTGNLEILQWCRANGCEWSAFTSCSAAEYGHLHVLEWLHANGCPWNLFTCSSAAKGGHLEVLKWLRSKGSPWCHLTCSNASMYGHLHVLKWAYENGCDCDYQTCVLAYKYERWEVLQWALANRLPLDTEFFHGNFWGDNDSEMEHSDAFEFETDDSDDDSYVCPCCQALLSQTEQHGKEVAEEFEFL